MTDDDATIPESAGPTGRRQGGQQIGPYRLLEKLGAGGMGEVWLAQQDKPRRQVALKLVRHGLDNEQVLIRFEAERQALALMDHDNIAKVFDVGETDDGHPYFVMEHVKGEPITEYCDRHRLTPRQRLELFLDVCRGVQHAHQKAVIHRDLKPSNVLVAEQDGRPVPKIIDFGIAKAINRELTEQTLFTELGQIIGTPEYMAPEQAELFDADVDSRADVYSMGVLLYELLVGARPFDSRELRRAGFAEIHRHIREVEPPKPSTRASSLGEAISEVAALRAVDPSSLMRVLRGDLDWVTMKALEKDRERRYGSVGELSADVQRHLENQPVVARPPSRSYQRAKFVRRNRVATLAGLAVAAALLVGSSVAVWQALEARRAEQAALEQARRADRQALTADRVSKFLLSLFRSTDPYRSAGEESLSDVLDRGLEQIDELRGEPLVQADLLSTLGDAMITTGRRDEGVALIKRSLELRESALPEGDADLLYFRWFTEDRGSTGPFDERWLGLAEAAYTALEGRTDVISLNRKAQMLLSRGAGALRLRDDLDAAIDHHEEALEILERLEAETGQRFEPTPTAIENLGFLATMKGDLAAAEVWYDKGLEYTATVLGKDHVRYAQSLGQYANLLRDLERHDEAEQMAIEGYERRLAALGRETGNVVYDLGVVTSVYRDQNKLEPAERWAREALAAARRIDRGVDMGTCVLADVLVAKGDVAAAEPLLEEAAGLGAADEFDCRRARGFLALARGDVSAGDALLEEAWTTLQQRDPMNFTVRALAAEAESVHRARGNAEQAKAWKARLEQP